MISMIERTEDPHSQAGIGHWFLAENVLFLDISITHPFICLIPVAFGIHLTCPIYIDIE